MNGDRRQWITRVVGGLTAATVIPTRGFQSFADENKSPQANELAFEFTNSQVFRFRVGIGVKAVAGTVKNVLATGPIPIAWPEQQLELISEDKPRGTTVRAQRFPGQATMLVCRFPIIVAGQTATVERTYELKRSHIRLTGDTSQLVKPVRPSRALREFLGGGVGVDISSRRVTQLVKELAGMDETDWQQVRRIYDWVRGHIRYQMGAYRGTTGTLKAEVGDCEDMSALFVSLCRASGVPARTVWVGRHAYAEFYLESANGTAFWVPVQLAGPAWFGEMREVNPILQKGDRFLDAITRRYSHYVPQSVRADGPVKLDNSRIIVKLAGVDS
ncbi:MAG: transglutaminase-like domain-containing protein [Planctomycetota bacterium]|nr:transglutaminase-like domain-containing protein [Planctomycetota bacterium]